MSGRREVVSSTSARRAGGMPSRSACCNWPNHSTIPAILGAQSAASCSLTPIWASWANFSTLGGSMFGCCPLLLAAAVAVGGGGGAIVNLRVKTGDV